MASPVPINVAEATLDPFWDPPLSGLPHWQIEPGEAHGLRVAQNWCWVSFEWARRPAAGPALRMTRRYDVDCRGYDGVVVSAMAPAGAVLRLAADTDAGPREFIAPPAGALKREHILELDGAVRLLSLTLELHAGADGIAAGWLNWIGLRNAQLLRAHRAQWQRLGEGWERYLKPATAVTRFAPEHGILMDEAELEAWRRRHDAWLARHGSSPLMRLADEARQFTPEQMVREFVNFWGDTRYCRERDHGNQLLTHGPNAALAGLLLRDAELLRLGARFAVALALCGRWDDGMICHCPGSAFDHRCFVQSLCAHECALLLDLAGECFTDAGRQFILRRIGEEGLGVIAFNTWKYEYIFHCNQLAWFSPGRLAACALLAKSWPRVRPYMELAHRDLVESLGYAILPDGGYVEGPTYFTCVGSSGGRALYYYARATGQSFTALLPDGMRRTADFAAAVASTVPEVDVIPICDARDRLDHDTLAVMATALSASPWVTMYRKAVARDGMPATALAARLDDDIPAAVPAAAPFVFLPVMGVMASVRQHAGHDVKLLLMGNHAGAGHTHEDKGSFVLEFAGDTFAMDPGTCDYSSPLAAQLHNAERHNMLVPAGCAERPHPQCPLPVDVKPEGGGDAEAFRAEIDATPGWAGYYRRWHRAWESPSPDALTVTDEWELERGTGVEFLWQTRLPVDVGPETITVRGRHGRVELRPPPGATVRVDELPLLDGVQRRIVVSVAARQGRLAVTARLVAGV